MVTEEEAETGVPETGEGLLVEEAILPAVGTVPGILDHQEAVPGVPAGILDHQEAVPGMTGHPGIGM